VKATPARRPGILRKLKKPIEFLKILFAWVVVGAILVWSKPNPAQFWLGSGCFCIAQILRVWAAGHLRRGAVLTTDGPYAYVRDPLYLGRLFWVLGLGFYSGQPWIGLALLAIFLWFYCRKKIPKEMKNLEKLFGKPYLQYCAEVRSLLPRLRPYPHRAGNRWQWSVFRENKEIWSVLIVAAVIALFGAKTFQ